MAEQLQLILGNDNTARKNAEENIKVMRESDADKYVSYLSILICDGTVDMQIKSLSAVILRRTLTTFNDGTKSVLWDGLKPETKQGLKGAFFDLVKQVDSKDFCHKLCNLLVEIQGAMFDEKEEIWSELLNLVFQLVNSEEKSLHVDAALQIFNGLFSYIIDHLNQYKSELYDIFVKTLNHNDLDIKLAALRAVSNYLETVEQKDTKKFIALIPDMVKIVLCAVEQEDEVVLKDALVEFNEIAEIEPKFFQSKFKDIFEGLSPIVTKNRDDFANEQIRQLPIEFFVTVIERIPSIAKKNVELLKNLIEIIFKLMIDIDDSIPESWERPKEGFREKEEEDTNCEDNVDFGKSCIDKIISAVGD